MDDARIIQLYWDRDEQAIRATSEKYGRYCASIARNILGNPEDAEECVNDTYLHAWNAMPPHRPALLPTFLGRLTRNLSLNKCRYLTARRRSGVTLALEELSDVVSGTALPEQELQSRELLAAIDAFLAALPQKKRRIFVCRYWYFDSIPSIAAQFGTTENAVSAVLSRTRRKLCHHLAGRGFLL